MAKAVARSSSLLRGTTSLTLSYIFFLGAGYVAQVWIARFLSAEVYGLFGILLVSLNISELAFSTGLLRHVTTLIAKEPERAARVIRRGRSVQYVAIALVSLALLVFAPQIADVFHASELQPYLRFLALMFPFYGLRSFYASILAGFRLFERQALHRAVGGALKLFAIPAVAVTHDLYGVLGAYLLSSVYLLIAYRFEARRAEHIDSGEGVYPLKPFLLAILPMLGFVGLFPLLQSLDVYAVKALLPAMPEAAGFYTAASTLAKVPFLLFSSLTLTLLPALARAFARNAPEDVRQLQRRTDGLFLLVLLPSILLPLSFLGELLGWIFPASYAVAGPVLGVLLVAVCASVLFENGLLYFVAAESYRVLAWFVGIAVAAFIVLLYFLTPLYGMIGAALAAAFVAGLGALCVRIATFRTFRTGFPSSRLLRILPAALLASAFGFLFSFSGAAVLLHVFLVGVAYVLLLFLFRAISPEERSYVTRLLALLSRRLPGRTSP